MGSEDCVPGEVGRLDLRAGVQGRAERCGDGEGRQGRRGQGRRAQAARRTVTARRQTRPPEGGGEIPAHPDCAWVAYGRGRELSSRSLG